MHNRTATFFMALLVAAGCGSDDPAGLDTGAGNMSARIDGEAWSSAMEQVAFSANVIAVAGSDAAGRALGMAWVDEGAGTYTIEPGEVANANYSAGSALWIANAHQGIGTVVVTTRSPGRVTGTFTFTLEPVPNTAATGTRSVTQGVFDVTY